MSPYFPYFPRGAMEIYFGGGGLDRDLDGGSLKGE